MYTMYIHTPDYRFIFCDFEFDCAEERIGALYSGQELKNIGSLFEKLFNIYRSSSICAYAECMSVLYGIYGAIQQSVKRIYIDRDKKNVMLKAKIYIDENFISNTLSISALAEMYGISEVYFRKLFKANFGLSPSKYVLTVKLDKAKKLMNYPFLTLEECALQSGFSSLQYFCRIFKKETGISQAKYRLETSQNRFDRK